MNNESLNNEVDVLARELATTIPVTFNPQAWEKMEQLLEATPATTHKPNRFRGWLYLLGLLLTGTLLSGLFLLPQAKDLHRDAGQPNREFRQPVVDSSDRFTAPESRHGIPASTPANKQQPVYRKQPGVMPGLADSTGMKPLADTTGKDVFIFW